MTEWPVRPRSMDEHEWYREIEKQVRIAVISADREAGECGDCRAVRTRYQCQLLVSRQIVALCKDCALQRAGDEGAFLWVRTDAYLRQKWTRDGKDPVKSARARSLQRAPEAGKSASAPSGRVKSHPAAESCPDAVPAKEKR